MAGEEAGYLTVYVLVHFTQAILAEYGDYSFVECSYVGLATPYLRLWELATLHHLSCS
jgi:hypothetical protein